MPLTCQRELFDLPAEVSYLNAAYWTPLARTVREAGRKGIDRKRRPWEIQPEHYFSDTAVLRDRVAGLLGANRASIAIAPSTSYGNAIAARNLPLAAGQSVLVVEDQYPSSYYTWRERAERAGATLQTVARPDGAESWSDAVLAAIDSTTAIVAVPNVHWSDGAVFDLAAIAARCREVGAAFVTDLTQSLGVLPFSVAEVDPDFVVAASYKWLLGPYSISFVYAAPRHHAGAPIEQSWMARKGCEDFANLARYTGEMHPDARRFDVGEASNFVLVPMAIAALGLIEGWGVEAILDRIRSLGQRLRAGAGELGLVSLPSDRSAPHIVGLELAVSDPASHVARLAEQRIYVSLRGRTVRVSPHVYNDEADIDRLLAGLVPH